LWFCERELPVLTFYSNLKMSELKSATNEPTFLFLPVNPIKNKKIKKHKKQQLESKQFGGFLVDDW
jgi:hypothetical protein